MEKLLGGWKAAEASPSPPPPPQAAPARRIVLIDRPGAAQTELAIGGLLMERRDPDFIAMVVLNGVLGGTIGSRLYPDSARREGILLQPGQRLQRLPLCGILARKGRGTDGRDGGFDCHRHGATPAACATSPFRNDELERAKSNAVGSFALRLEQPSQVINQSYLRYRYGFSADYWERYPAKVNSVSAAEIQAVAQKYLAPRRAQIVVVGDAAHIRPALDKLGKVEV